MVSVVTVYATRVCKILLVMTDFCSILQYSTLYAYRSGDGEASLVICNDVLLSVRRQCVRNPEPQKDRNSRDPDVAETGFIGFKAKVFLKVEGQCTEAMKSL